jgi:hypothetical protein
MKTTKQICKCITLSTIILAVATVAWMPGSARAQETNAPMKPMKSGEHLMMLNHITTQAQVDELKAGDSIAMVCSKCKTVSTEFITKESKGNVTIMTPGGKHLCPGCGSTVTVVGVGKGASAQIKHVCGMCGSGSMFCCATTTNAPPTAGMETK